MRLHLWKRGEKGIYRLKIPLNLPFIKGEVSLLNNELCILPLWQRGSKGDFASAPYFLFLPLSFPRRGFVVSSVERGIKGLLAFPSGLWQARVRLT